MRRRSAARPPGGSGAPSPRRLTIAHSDRDCEVRAPPDSEVAKRDCSDHGETTLANASGRAIPVRRNELRMRPIVSSLKRCKVPFARDLLFELAMPVSG